MQLENGTYPAHPTGRVEVGEHANGCLIATMEFDIGEGRTISNVFWLTTKDGAINTRSIETLKEIFGWDGADPFWLADHAVEFVDVAVELVIKNETFQGNDGNDHTVPKVKWVNPIGGGVQIANSDRKALTSKYGAKLRAVSGGTPATKKTAPPAAPAKAALPPEPKQNGIPSDMHACWKTLTDAMADKPRNDVEAQWFEIIKEACGDKPQADYTPADWGVVMAKIKTTFDNLPF